MKSFKSGTSRIALGASMVALIFATDALAQQKKEVSTDTVVVTATGRARALQDIPVAVTALTAASIQSAGITDVRNLQQVTPSYKVQTGQSNGSSAQIQVRGIGTGSDNPGYEGAVAVFVDGVYRNRSGAALTDLPKVDRIEVLRGPQGTLFGRNTSAGAVSITTSAPKFERNVYGKIDFGNFGLVSPSLGYTNAVTEHTAIRAEIGGTSREGLLTEVNTGKDINNKNRYYARLQTLTELGNDATFRMILDKAQTDELCCSAVRVKSGSVAAGINGYITGPQGLIGVPPVNEEAALIANSPNRPLTEKVDDRGISGELNWNTKLGKFTSITAYRKWDLFRQQDADFSGLDRAYRDNYDLKFDTFTQEFRLNGKAGKLDWLVGAFYLDEQTSFDDSIKFGKDAAKYVDLLTMGVSKPWTVTSTAPVNPCTMNTTLIAPGSTVFGSFGGTSIFQQALCPSLVGQFLQANMPLNVAIAQAQAISALYGNTLKAASITMGEGQQTEHSNVDANSLALFTHNVYELTPNDKFTLGLRYNIDNKDVASSLNATSAACSVMQNSTNIGGGITFKALSTALQAAGLSDLMSAICHPAVNTSANGNYAGSNEEKEWSGTASYAHNFSKNLMTYVTYSRGYKAGGFNYDRMALNITPAGNTTPSVNDWRVKPEFTDNIELGWKMSNLPGRTTFNGAIFNETITDYQMNAWTGFSFRSFNVDKMVSRGVELDLTSRPISGLTLNAGMMWNDAFYDSDATLPNSTTVVINKGSQLATAPEWSATGSINYRKPIAGTSLDMTFYLDGLYNSDTKVQTLSADPSTEQKAYSVFNTRVGIGSSEGEWSVELWCKNLTDELYHGYALGIPEQPGEYAVYKTDPRTYGMTLRASF
jgi:iron complex outermembrane recepter protein